MPYEELMETILQRGSCCAESLVRFGLALRGEENEPLANAAAGLCNGLHSGYVCGALSGGALLLSLFDKQSAARVMIPELTEWFDVEFGMEYGTVNCEDILTDPGKKLSRCRPLTIRTAQKCVELLTEGGYLIRE